ncbi:UNVERIFIED_CONTAM: hypothetical protein NCL1_09937 [Trichonephila clavipes]
MPNSRESSHLLLEEVDDHEGLSGEALEFPPQAAELENSTVVYPMQPACQREARLHPCLSGQVVSPNDPGEGSWSCPSCDTVLTTKLGLLNHEKSHKRQEIRERMPALTIPVGPARRKAQRRRRIKAISTGHPRDMPLAPPPQDQNILTLPLRQQVGNPMPESTLHREEE